MSSVNIEKLFVVFFLGLFLQCQSQELKETMIPKISNEFEKITIQNFKKKKDDRCIETPEAIKETFSASKTGYRVSIYHGDTFYKLDKSYYKNGYIKNKSLSFNMGSSVGILYHFDKSGRLIKEENTDEGYNFKPENIITYCEKNKIDLPKGYHDSGYQTRVLKQDFEGKKVWRISHQIAGDKIEEIILDGKTGKELQKKTVPFYNP
ncbi:hypothetical protein [Chryseobacterium sp. CH21]|uniref:hypothetical protein n=1 Tax=Chryseobacterium sp. CH21 TaxID=713556 RepID=UPI001E52DAAD|nr:hypothetical protein [Chryseobacterium sp. CH21]